MIYAYILASDAHDYYSEQTLISIYSLRKYNPDAYVCLICDEETFIYLNISDHMLNILCDEIKAVSVPTNFTQMQKSRFMKTSLRNYISGDFVFLDSDTVIIDSLKELDNFPYEIGMVKQQDSDDWCKSNPHKHLKKYNKARNRPEEYNYGIENFYNSGMILCRDTEVTHKFYEIWHKRWKRSAVFFDFNMDQSDLWITNKEFGNIIAELPGQYNCMAHCYNISLKFLGDCKVFHYVSTSTVCKYLQFRNPEFLKTIREKGLDPTIDDMIKNIKKEFLDGLYIIPKESIASDEILITIAKILSRKFPLVNKTLNKLKRYYEKFNSKDKK